MLSILPGIHFDPRMCPAAQPGHFGVRVDPPPPTIGYRRAMDTYQIYDGIDENGIVGTLAPGLFAQEGRCWRMVYEIPVGHGTHCMSPVEWVGRWRFLDGWTKVWSCERHTDEVVGPRRLPLRRGTQV